VKKHEVTYEKLQFLFQWEHIVNGRLFFRVTM